MGIRGLYPSRLFSERYHLLHTRETDDFSTVLHLLSWFRAFSSWTDEENGSFGDKETVYYQSVPSARTATVLKEFLAVSKGSIERSILNPVAQTKVRIVFFANRTRRQQRRRTMENVIRDKMPIIRRTVRDSRLILRHGSGGYRLVLLTLFHRRIGGNHSKERRRQRREGRKVYCCCNCGPIRIRVNKVIKNVKTKRGRRSKGE